MTALIALISTQRIFLRIQYGYSGQLSGQLSGQPNTFKYGNSGQFSGQPTELPITKF